MLRLSHVGLVAAGRQLVAQRLSDSVNYTRLEISMWLEQLPKLLEKLAVAREIARRIFPLHLVEQCTRTLQHFVAGSRVGRASCRRWRTDKEALGIGERARPFDLAVIGQKLPQHHAGEHRDPGLLSLDIDRLEHNELIVDKRQHNEIAANDMRNALPSQEGIIICLEIYIFSSCKTKIIITNRSFTV
jgi:hypothetical protein